jgi:cellulose synthase (UDP-forming)
VSVTSLPAIDDLPVISHGNTLYAGSSTIAGPVYPPSDRVCYREILSGRQQRVLRLLVGLNVLASAALLGWLLWPSHFPLPRTSPMFLVEILGLGLMVTIEAIRVLQTSALWIFAGRARDPIPTRPAPGLRVAVLTTIVPGKEPLDLVMRTLRAMRTITHDGVMDVWLLDEGNDPHVRAACESIGVFHFSRRGVERYNQPSGQFKARTKHGNHNAWRDSYESHYDVVAQMDPDHIPSTDFLRRTLGYFSDPDVGFVVAPQVYGNLGESWIAHGAAVQAYVFHGVIQRGGNGMEAPLLIGTNHLYRTSTFQQIGGYQDSIIEDHLTSMVVYASSNPRTGNRWKGVYTPDILAVGEGPTSFTDYFNQQKRWAYGIWEIMTNHSPRLVPRMKPAQRLSFGLLQMFYPSVAVSFVLGNLLSALYLAADVTTRLPLWQWAILWSTSIASSLWLFFWLRRFNLVAHERNGWGLAGMGLLLMTGPIYVAAMLARLARRPLAYAVTAKGDLTSADRWSTFRFHIAWAACAGVQLVLSFAGLLSDHASPRAWLMMTAVVCAVPLLIHGMGHLRADHRASPSGIAIAAYLAWTGLAVALPILSVVGALPHSVSVWSGVAITVSFFLARAVSARSARRRVVSARHRRVPVLSVAPSHEATQ